MKTKNNILKSMVLPVILLVMAIVSPFFFASSLISLFYAASDMRPRCGSAYPALFESGNRRAYRCTHI